MNAKTPYNNVHQFNNFLRNSQAKPLFLDWLILV